MDDAPSQHHEAHGPTLTGILAVFGGLLVLTAVTVLVAYSDLGRWSAPVALGIAAVKGTIVVLYFMHVRYASRLIALVAVSGFFFLAILLGITMSEVVARPAQPVVDPLGIPTAAATAPVRRPAGEEPP